MRRHGSRSPASLKSTRLTMTPNGGREKIRQRARIGFAPEARQILCEKQAVATVTKRDDLELTGDYATIRSVESWTLPLTTR
jgi:hypothetical protein